LLELPTDHPRPMVKSYRGARASCVLNAQLTHKLKALAQAHDATLYMVLYAGFTVLLSRLSGQSDIVVGVPVANRQRSEVEGLIGFFVNTLALRMGIKGEWSVGELLKRAKRITLEGFEHQQMPFEQVVEAINPPRSLGHSPLFQA